TFAREPAYFIAAKCVQRVNADTDYIPGLDGCGVHLLQGFIHKDGISEALRCGGSEHKQPPWCDDSNPKGTLARIHEVYGHRSSPNQDRKSPRLHSSH